METQKNRSCVNVCVWAFRVGVWGGDEKQEEMTCILCVCELCEWVREREQHGVFCLIRLIIQRETGRFDIFIDSQLTALYINIYNWVSSADS